MPTTTSKMLHYQKYASHSDCISAYLPLFCSCSYFSKEKLSLNTLKKKKKRAPYLLPQEYNITVDWLPILIVHTLMHFQCNLDHKDITSLTAWRTSIEGRSIWVWQSFLKKEPSSIRSTLKLFERQCWGNFWQTGWSVYGLSRVLRYHLQLKKLRYIST